MPAGTYYSEGPNGTLAARRVIQDGETLLCPDTGAVLVTGAVPQGAVPGGFVPDEAPEPPAKKKTAAKAPEEPPASAQS